jgi:hypothetical protein
MRYQLVMAIDVGVSALTHIQNEIRNHKVSPKPSEDMKVEALLANLEPEYEFIVAGIDVSDTTKYEDVVAELRKAEARLNGQNQGQNPAHFTSTAITGKKGQGRKKESRFHYGKEGHYKTECRKFLAEQAKTDKNDTKTQDSRTGGSKDDQDKGQYSHTAASANRGPEQTRDEPRTWAVSHQAQKVTAGTGGTRDRPVMPRQRSHVTHNELQGRVYVYEKDQGYCYRCGQ